MTENAVSGVIKKPSDFIIRNSAFDIRYSIYEDLIKSGVGFGEGPVSENLCVG